MTTTQTDPGIAMLNYHQSQLADFISLHGWQSVMATLQGMALAEAQLNADARNAFELVARLAAAGEASLAARGVR